MCATGLISILENTSMQLQNMETQSLSWVSPSLSSEHLVMRAKKTTFYSKTNKVFACLNFICCQTEKKLDKNRFYFFNLVFVWSFLKQLTVTACQCWGCAGSFPQMPGNLPASTQRESTLEKAKMESKLQIYHHKNLQQNQIIHLTCRYEQGVPLFDRASITHIHLVAKEHFILIGRRTPSFK